MAKAKIITVLREDYRSILSPELTVGVVVADFNRSITDRLLTGALGFLNLIGLQAGQILVCRVPGALEIPLICSDLCHGQKVSALVALGAVIRGKTFHFEIVCLESARAITDVSLYHRIPIANGILTCNTQRQALDRSGGREGNKGWDAARTALDVLKLRKALSADSPA